MSTFLKIWTVIFFTFISINLYSQTEIDGGEVSGVWTKANSPYYINREIVITDGKTLTIQAGVEVIFTGHYKLKVQGRLLVNGNQGDSVKFTTRKDSTWHGIRFISTRESNDTSLINYCIFENGKAKGAYLGVNEDNWGGAIYVDRFHKIKIYHSRFSNNYAQWGGGAIACNYSTIQISNCKITNNYSLDWAGGICLSTCNAFIENNIISNNEAQWRGGAIYAGASKILLIGNHLMNNLSFDGGVIQFQGEIQGSRLINNIMVNNAGSQGGCINIDNSGSIQFINNIICNNYSKSNGGAVYISGNSLSTFANNIIFGNKAENEGNQFYIQQIASYSYFNSNNIQGGFTNFKGTGISVYNIENIEITNIDADPQFVNPSKLVGIDNINLTTDWRLQAGSACINAGITDTTNLNLPVSDFSGNTRISDGRVDIGAIEYQNVAENLKADFYAFNTWTTIKPFGVTFKDSSEGSPTSWEWDFGDGATSNLQNPIHIFQNFGQYNVSLTIRKGNNVHTETKNHFITVGQIKEVGPGEAEGIWDTQVICVNGDIIIPSDKTLTIQPGVNVLFSGQYVIAVKGKLIAKGTKTDSIIFSTNPNAIHWGGIKQISTPQDTSIYEYCRFEKSFSRKFEEYNLRGGAIYVNQRALAKISDCVFENNKSPEHGGAISLSENSSIIRNCRFERNYSYWSGDAISLSHGSGSITGNIFYNNLNTSCILIEGFSTMFIANNVIINNNGCAFSITNDSRPQIINNTICFNKGGIICIERTRPVFINNIVYKNTPDIYGKQFTLDNYPCLPSFNNNLIENGLIKENNHADSLLNKLVYKDNIDADPNFETPNQTIGLNNILNKSYWTLTSKSPCINSGKPDLSDFNIPQNDVLLNNRISDGRIDIGAYEFQNATQNLKADFTTSSVSSNSAPYKITFSNKSTGLPVSWEWDFGDGTTISLENPEHIYKKLGLFSVSLTIRKGNDIHSITKNKYITIGRIKEAGPGNVEGTWDYNIVRINGDITIPNGNKLEIKPGTRVEFTGPWKINVQGSIIAKGTASDSIWFTSVNDYINWKSIRFISTPATNDSSIFEYCIIEKSESFDGFPWGGGAVNVIDFSKIRLNHSILRHNKALYDGGCLSLYISSPIIENCTFNDNVSSSAGGAMHIQYASSPRIINNFFYNNTASRGSAIEIIDRCTNIKIKQNIFYNNSCMNWGTILISQNNEVEIFNNTICYNYTDNNSPAIHLDNNINISVINNILFNNKTRDSFNQVTLANQVKEILFKNNNIQGGKNGFYFDNCTLNFNDQNYQDNIDAIPGFLNPPAGVSVGYTLKPVDFMIQRNSSCINTGKTDTTGLSLPKNDIFGLPRISSGVIDIGAHEYPDYDIGISAYLSKIESCQFIDKETVKIRIKNSGLKTQSKYLVSFSMNGGVTYVSENVTTPINPGDSLDYSFQQAFNFKNYTSYSCIAIVKTSGDYNFTNDTLRVKITSSQFSSGLKSEYQFCQGETDTIKASPGLQSYSWTGGTSSTFYLTVNKSGTYALRATNAEGCVANENTVVTFNNLPVAPAGADRIGCEGTNPVSLTVTGTNIKWYSDSRLINVVASGNSFKPANLKEGLYQYYATQTDAVFGCISPASEIKLTVNKQPVAPEVSDKYIGLGDVSKEITAKGTQIKWYSKPDYTGFLHEGNIFNPNKADLDTIEYFVTQTVNGCESPPKKIFLYILDIPSPPLTNDQIICNGKSDPILYATGLNIKWYDDKGLTNLVGTGTEFNTGQINAGEYTYYVTQMVNDLVSATGTVKLTIYEVPEPPAADNVIISKSDKPEPLFATGQNIKWYTDEALNNKIFEGNEFNPEKTIAGVYTYYVTQAINGCESYPLSVDYTLSETLSIVYGRACQGKEGVIQVSNQNVKWYADSAKTELLATGNTFKSIEKVPGQYVYYYTVTYNTIESDPARAILTILPLPPKPELLRTGEAFCYGDILNCTNYDKQYSYNWYLNNAIIPGELGSEYELKKDLRGYLKLTVTDLNTKCLNTSDTFFISTNLPEIVLKGDNILICMNLDNDFKAWQWFRDNQKIDNATYQFYEAKQSGEYFTEATNTTNCKIKSNKISLSVPTSARLYPTINHGSFTIELNNQKNENVHIKIYSIFGLKVKELEQQNKSGTQIIYILAEGLQSGFYIVEVQTGEKKYIEKMFVE